MLFPNIARDILGKLIAAEERGNPITLKKALKIWGSGSTWEDLVDGGYISRLPKAVTATNRGREYFGKEKST